MTWLRKKRRDDALETPSTVSEHPCGMHELVLNTVDRNDPIVRRLTEKSDGKPLPSVPRSGGGLR